MDTSLIGNYIHYKYDNYRRYGLQLKGKESTKVLHKGSLNKYLDEARNEARQFAQGSVAANQALALQNYLNKLQLNNVNNTNTNQDEDLQGVVMQEFHKFFSSLSSEDFDWSTFTLTPAAKQKLRSEKVDQAQVAQILGSNAKLLKVDTLLQSSLGSRAKQAGVGNTPVHAFQTQIANLRAALQVLQQDLSVGTTTIKKIEKNIEALEKAKIDMSKTVNVHGGSGIFKEGKNGVSEEYSILQLIRLTAKAIYAQAAISLIEGTFFESVLAGAAQQLAQAGQQGFEEVCEALVSGAAKGQAAIQSNNFSSNINLNTALGNKYQVSENINGIINYTIGAQQGKMDVKIMDNANSLISGISAKSYTMSNLAPKHSNISVVSGTNILYTFQKKGEFLNHYLNQTVETVPISSVISQANEIMKQMILLTAIAGGGIRINETTNLKQSQMQSSIFALNDKSQPGGVRIIPVSQLFSKLISHGDQLYNINMSDGHTWPNKWGSTKWDRINSLISAVHQYKIKASISKNAFKII